MQARRFGRIVHVDSEVAGIAATVSFLASEEAGFVTGERIVVNGGRSLGR